MLMRYLQNDRPKKKKKKKKDMAVTLVWWPTDISGEFKQDVRGKQEDIDLYGLTCGKKGDIV